MNKGEAIVRLRNMVACYNMNLGGHCSGVPCEQCVIFDGQGSPEQAKEYLQMALDALEREFRKGV